MLASKKILKTKLFPPRATPDFVERKALNVKFEKLKHSPIMLVSGATGYGKSTLVANYLSKKNEDFAWFSLSDKENNFQQFIEYFIAAVQSKINSFGEELVELAQASQPPSTEELAELVLNELAEVKKHFYLVVDDYHLIKNSNIHQFIQHLFTYPQPFFRLIIITRRDPALPLYEWRSKNKLIEIRSSSMKFSRSEIAEFYEKVLLDRADEEILKLMEQATEGWIAGLRMMMLSSPNKEDLAKYISNLDYRSGYIINELIDSVLNNLKKATRDRLLRLSLLKEFNVELFSAICLKEDEQDNKLILFDEFISTITHSNLFIVGLDDKHNWYRFHHMFTEQLLNVLQSEYDETSINEMRKKIAEWYRQNDFHEEAIEFYLAANKFDNAVSAFSDYKLKLISEAQFGQLENIFNLFPDYNIDKNSELLLAQAWVYYYKGNVTQFAKLCARIEELIENEERDPYEKELMLGEVYALKAYDLYLGNINLEACMDYSKKAIKFLRNKNPYACGLAWIFYSGTLQIVKNTDTAITEINKELETCIITSMRSQVLLVLWYMYWFEADLINSIKIAEQLIELGNTANYKTALAHGNGFMGAAYFNLYKNDDAIPYLDKALDLKYFSLQAVGFPPIVMLTKILAEKEDYNEVERLRKIIEKDAVRGGKRFEKIANALNADIDMYQDNIRLSLRWALKNDYKNFLPLLSFYNPEITQAKILALDNNKSSMRLSLKILDLLIPFFKERKNSNFLIKCNVVKALTLYKMGNTREGYNILENTLELTEPRHFIRPYIELGSKMKFMLQESKKTSQYVHHIEEILKCFDSELKTSGAIILSPREKEILLMSEKMTNKELGNKLFISEKTVKTHITNINKKLKVKSKSEAIAKAKELSLI
jgi:LuxR family maltose regulon positive regulatory protein